MIIPFGLAIQKLAHNRVAALAAKAEAAGKPPPTLTIQKMPLWWMGLFMMIAGELGNAVAYGDGNTPAAVVTAVGCIGVIANAVISTVFLKEPFRMRDVLGGALVVIGVVQIVIFAPQSQRTLTPECISSLLSRGIAIGYLIFAALGIVVLLILCPRFGHRHVLWWLSLASLIGSFTVVSVKTVSTLVVTFTIMQGQQQFDQPLLYIFLVVLVVTAIAQVVFMTKGMQFFDNPEVRSLPRHCDSLLYPPRPPRPRPGRRPRHPHRMAWPPPPPNHGR